MFVLDRISEYAKTDRIAWRCRDKELSFAELDARSDAFAAWLLAHFGASKAPVVIYGGKEPDFLPCLFGALKSGRPYVPVDTVLPLSRAADIISEVGPCVVVNFSGRGLNADACVLDSAEADLILGAKAESKIPKEYRVGGSDAAYILFTSGSTGAPKGVPITAGNLAAFYRGILPYMSDVAEGVILDQVSYSFDVSCCSVYAGLSLGMTLFAVDKEMAGNIGELFAALKDSRLTMWVSTPSFAEVCVRGKSFASALTPRLAKLLFCGEVLTRKLCDELAERFPHADILNTYGPTETTVLVAAVVVTEEMRRGPLPIPIGQPIDGITLRLDGVTTQDGEERGELLILGDSVGPGYYRRPELTGERFFTDKDTGLRGYQTGDICTVHGGLYYYRGRRDNQIKINGFRVEIEDIEHNLEKLPEITRAAVIPVYDGDKAQYLAAFVLYAVDSGMPNIKRAIEIKKQAAEFLPAYMIPRKIVAVSDFPLNTNGKIDKKELAKRLRGEP